MQWNTFGEFVAMGGYGGYVWGAYGVTFALLVAELFQLRGRGRQALQRARLFARRGDDA